MSEQWDTRGGFELERYELDMTSGSSFDLDRREFLAVLGGGIAVVMLAERAGAQRPGDGRRRGRDGGAPQEISAWLQIDEDGQVTVFTGKVEVGQNIRTSLTQVVAEELPVSPDDLQLVMGDTQRTPFDAGTFGSRTTPVMAQQLRAVAATAREILIDLAAERWEADRAALTVADGKVVHNETKESASFGQLTQGQALTQTISEDAQTTPPDQWTVAGRSAPKIRGRDFVTGKHRYTSDLKLPGMWYGKVLRPPSFNATLVSIDTQEAESMPDVVVVRDGDFVGIAAPSVHQAEEALETLEAEWEEEEEQISSDELFDHLKQSADRNQGGGSNHRVGSIEQGMEMADVQLEQTYTHAYIAHVPLEPRAAVAQWDGEELTVWTGTQRPFGVRSELAGALGVDEERVRVLVPDTGSAYGGKHTGEAAVEAARLARAAEKPVKLTWTREEEFTWAYFRPAGVIEVASGCRQDGTLTAWQFHNYNSGTSAIRTLYEVPHQQIEFHRCDSPLRQGSYRALAATANHFARETHMDELAQAVEMDPLEFRLKNLQDPRLRAVLEAAAEKFGWGGEPAEEDHGFGIAGGFEKGGYVATCVEVAVDRRRGRVEVVRAVCAFECGAIVNPDNLSSQVEGCVMMGLGGALYEAIEFENGRIVTSLMARYDVPRFADTPDLEVVLLDRKDLPSAGAGETPIVAIAPAIGNAIFNATAVRLRSLPLPLRELAG